jgi:eukaryotic-like serine/threonine-protein kinase
MSDFFEVVGGYLGRLTGILTWGNVKLLTGAFVLLWVVLAINRRLGLFSHLGDVVSRLLGKPVEGLRSRASAMAAEKSGDFLTAGLSYDRQGDWEKALDCYEKAEEYHLAGELCLRLGHKEVAAEWLSLSNEKLRAAELYRELGRHQKAAEAYTKAGSSLEAASEYLEAGMYAEAAAIYERAGNLVRAAEAHERGSDWKAAGECLFRQVMELDSRGSHYRSASQDAEISRLCHRAGRLFEKAGQTDRALELYERGGQVRLAADTAERLGQFRRAAELYRTAGSTEKAAELYERAGDAREAANLLGDERLSGGNALAAAEAFVKGGDLLRAAEVFETAGRFERASDCYEKVGAFREAAEAALRGERKGPAADLFVKAGQAEKAAELYFELGDFDLASLLFSKAGRHFDAARAAAESNSESKMVECLQRVPSDDPHYLVAVVELARAFARRGWSSLAREKLTSVLKGQEVTQQNLELWDELAKAEEDEGHFEDASSILRRMMAIQYNYGRASERYEKLEKLIEEEKMRSDTVRCQSPVAARSGNEPRYEVMGMLGKGGMGAVYKAYDHLLKRHVAYKVLAESLSRDPEARDTLLNEARAAAQLNHPNLVTIFDLGFDRGQAFICMELVEGESYQAVLRRKTWLEIEEATHWLVSVCQGLDHAHRRGIVHRDLKPSNVLLSADHRVKILDFGLARPADKESGPGNTNYSMSGTPKYISPEAIQGRPTDGRSDVYSLGATMFELLCGRPPFIEGNLLMHHLHTPPPSLRAIRSDIDAELEELVLLCLAKAPEERFQTAGEILSFASAARVV